jgi:hypothetical protein
MKRNWAPAKECPRLDLKLRPYFFPNYLDIGNIGNEAVKFFWLTILSMKATIPDTND